MKAHAPLHEALAFMLRRGRADQPACPAADAVIASRIVHHLCEAEKGEELAVELTRHIEAAVGDLNMRDAVYFHAFLQ